MKPSDLVLSIFPGIDLLGRAFEEQGWCVVRGPDLLWGGDIRSFHPPAGVFEGVIGGPPCQAFSVLRHLNPNVGKKHGNMIPEFERIVVETWPRWFLMENVSGAPLPIVEHYKVRAIELSDGFVGGRTTRQRVFSFGSERGVWLDIPKSVRSGWLKKPVVAGGGPAPGTRDAGDPTRLSIEEMCERQGLLRSFTDEMPFTKHGKQRVIGNGVPMAMGRAVAEAVRRATS